MALRCVIRVGALFPRQLPKRVAKIPVLSTVGLTRQISVSSANFIKEIMVKEENDVVTVEGQFKDSLRVPFLIKPEGEGCNACSLCALNLNLKHTDVLVLSQFMRSDGCMLPRRITGLCAKQQKRVYFIIAMSQKSGLMPNLAPSWSKRDPKLRNRSKKYNRYFDESTLPF